MMICLEPKLSKYSLSWICRFHVVGQVSDITLSEKLDYLCKCKSGIRNLYNAVEGHCLQAMKIVRHYANGCFHWLIPGHQSMVNHSREAISNCLKIQKKLCLSILWWPPGSTPVLGHIRDVQPEWVSFRGQKSADGCKFLPKNLRMGHNFNTYNLWTGHHG